MKAHRTDGVSLVFALIFLGVAGWWLVAQFLDLAVPEVGWILAGGLILVGVLGLLGALRSGRSSTPAAAPVTDAGPTPTSSAGLDPDAADPATAGFTTIEPTTAEYGYRTDEFPRIDPTTTDPLPAPPSGDVDRPRPDDHRD